MDQRELSSIHRSHIRRMFLPMLAWAFFVPSLHGQNAAAAPPAPTTIVTSVNEVTVDLVARDKKNKPILDLKSEDITVTDSGKAVNVTDLRLVTGSAEKARLITLVFDRLEPSAAKNAREIAGRILKTVPNNGFDFAVLSVDGRLRLFQEFTPDRLAANNAVAAASERGQAKGRDDAVAPEKNLIAIAQTGTNSSGVQVGSEERHLAQMMLASLEDSQKIQQDQHAHPALSSLLALAQTQQQIPGRKVVVYFAQGLQLDSTSRDMLRDVVGAANRAGVSLYAVDANAIESQDQGLVATVAMGNVMSSNSQMQVPTGPNAPHGAYGEGLGTQISDQLTRIENEGLTGTTNPMAELAIATGGAYIQVTDNLRKPLEQLIEDMTTYYEASYAPPIQEYDGKFRPVAVKPVRKGIKIRSRAGYFALPPASGGAVQPFEAPLMKVLADPQLPSDLKFRAAVLRLGDLPDGNANALSVEVW